MEPPLPDKVEYQKSLLLIALLFSPEAHTSPFPIPESYPRTMSSFQYLCRFQTENGDNFFAKCSSTMPVTGALMDAYQTYEDLEQGQNATTATIAKVCCYFLPNSVWTGRLTG